MCSLAYRRLVIQVTLQEKKGEKSIILYAVKARFYFIVMIGDAQHQPQIFFFFKTK